MPAHDVSRLEQVLQDLDEAITDLMDAERIAIRTDDIVSADRYRYAIPHLQAAWSSIDRTRAGLAD